jgi:hygromycin-B 7''-O-kinase
VTRRDRLLPVVRTWSEWARIFTDIELWTPVVRAICRREGVGCRDIQPGYPGTNAVYVVDRAHVVKVYAPFCHRDYELERELYPILAHDPQIPAPHLLAWGTWQDRVEWPYIVMDYLPGRPIGEVRDHILPSNRVAIAAHLGHILRRLHATSLDALGALDGSGREWRRFMCSRKGEFAEQFRREKALPPKVIDQCETWLTSVWEDVQSEHLVLLNGDVTQDHVLVQQWDGVWRISGLIDFADALIGQVEYEWVALWFGALDREAEPMRACIAAYDSDRALDQQFAKRAMAVTLLHEFSAGSIRWVLDRMGNPCVRSFAALQDLLWGDLAE